MRACAVSLLLCSILSPSHQLPAIWRIQLCGETYENIHKDRDFTTKECTGGKVCAPLSFNAGLCRQAEKRDKNIYRVLSKNGCGFVRKEPLVCQQLADVSHGQQCWLEAFCDKPKPPGNAMHLHTLRTSSYLSGLMLTIICVQNWQFAEFVLPVTWSG